jgi:hypothetical protein
VKDVKGSVSQDEKRWYGQDVMQDWRDITKGFFSPLIAVGGVFNNT